MKRFFTSKDTSLKIEEMKEKLAQSGTKVKIVALARIAFAISLKENKNSLVMVSGGTDGNEILDDHFFGENEVFYRTLLNTVYNKDLSDEEFFSNNGVVKYHVDKGTEIIYKIFEECDKNPELFKDKLIELAN